MINLVKNELYKIFKKKGIKVLCAVVLFVSAITFGGIKLVDNVNSIFGSDEYYEALEGNLSSYDLSVPAELGWYISDKIDIETYKYLKEYDVKSWQRAILETRIGEDISCIVNAEISKQTEVYDECKDRLDALKKEVDSHDWKYFANYELNELKTEKGNIETLLADANEEEKQELELSLKIINLKLDGIEYRLENDVSYGNTRASSLVEEYVTYGTEYLTLNMNKKIKTDNEIEHEKKLKSDYSIAKYKLDNGIVSSDDGTANEFLFLGASEIVLYILIVVIIVSSTSINDEFSNGTIKQLLLRPYKRGKILASKWIATFIVFVLFALYYYVVTTITYGLALGFESYLDSVIFYDFSVNAVKEMNVFKYVFINFVSVIPYYLIFLNIAFVIAVITGNTAASLGGSLMSYFAITLTNELYIMSLDKAWLQFFPTLCFDWSYYLFGGTGPNKYCELWSSVLVTVLILVLLYVIAYMIFTKKDIKNQ